MLESLAKVWKCLLKIPVIFAHFPLPTLALVGIVFVVAGSFSSCVTHKLEAASRAELKGQLAELRTDYAQKLTEAAEARASTIQSAAKEQNAINAENQHVWFEALSSLIATVNDKTSLEKLRKSIEELHNDPKFDCRQLPLPGLYLDSMHIDKESPKPAN
jgi:hypothetical protein